MSSTRNEKKTLINLPQQTSERRVNASSELNQLREENERLKEENEQLKRQLKQVKELNRKPNDRIDTLEEIIDERDDDIDTLKKEIDGGAKFGAIGSFNVSYNTLVTA
jgi:cell shape-determining protein MreC